MAGYIAIDLDGTLAHYDHWRGSAHIGDPVPAMLERVKRWIEEGIEVRIFTARVSTRDEYERAVIIARIGNWCRKHGLPKLKVTCCKDFGMVALYDDRCVAVEPNTGKILGGHFHNE